MLRLRIVDQVDNDRLVLRVAIAPRERALVSDEVRARFCSAGRRFVVDAYRARLAAGTANGEPRLRRCLIDRQGGYSHADASRKRRVVAESGGDECADVGAAARRDELPVGLLD